VWLEHPELALLVMLLGVALLTVCQRLDIQAGAGAMMGASVPQHTGAFAFQYSRRWGRPVKGRTAASCIPPIVKELVQSPGGCHAGYAVSFR
jgi:hypothetical protein